MKARLKTLEFCAKKVVPWRIRRKAKKVKDMHERIEVLIHAIMSYLDLKFHRVETILGDLEKKEVDVFHIYAKANLLKTKIKYYNINHHKSDFLKVMNLFEKIEKDLDNL